MAKKKRKQHALLLIHGMGDHAPPTEQGPGAFRKEFTTAINGALQRYPQHTGDDIENHLDLYEFNFNGWFDEVRNQMAKTAEPVGERLTAIEKKYKVTFAVDLVGKLVSLESRYGSEKFFYTHWLDVIFYATILGAKVRVDAGREIARLVKLYGPSRVHVFAHSLGTAVTHDTLALLYRPESDPAGNFPDLHLTNHKLASLWMVANVSRLVNSVTTIADPMNSVVRPGDDGCTNRFNSVRHELDPFTWISRFAPSNNGAWISEPTYDAFYKETRTSLVTNPNTHDLTQYVEDPAVSERLFSQLLLNFKFSRADLDLVREQYRKRSIQGAFALLEAEFADLSVKDIESWRDLLEVGSNLQAAIRLVKEAFP